MLKTWSVVGIEEGSTSSRRGQGVACLQRVRSAAAASSEHLPGPCLWRVRVGTVRPDQTRPAGWRRSALRCGPKISGPFHAACTLCGSDARIPKRRNTEHGPHLKGVAFP